MDTLLEAIDVCDVDGFCFGNYTDEEAGTGCTVIVAPEGATGGVDVRGGAPASRETDLLRPENTVDKVHAVCLSGGSAFGLEAASGVARELESRGIGLPVGPTQVPIVCSSCIFDLAFGDPTVRPDIEAGIAAVREQLAHFTTGRLGELSQELDPLADIAARIAKAVEQVQSAFHKQLDALNEFRFINLESEMDVLTDMLKSDGLTADSDTFTDTKAAPQEDDPFASLFAKGDQK